MGFAPLVFAIASSVLSGACVDLDTTGVAPTTGVWPQLEQRATLSVDTTSTLGVAARDDAGNDVPCIQPVVVGGDMTVRATESGLLIVEALDVALTDITIDAGKIADEPLTFTDLRLRLGTQLVLQPTWTAQTRSVHGAGTADLLLDWAVVIDGGTVHPLATQLVRDNAFAVRVELDELGDVHAELITTIDGPVWDWGRVALSDLSMAVYANELADPTAQSNRKQDQGEGRAPSNIHAGIVAVP